MKIKLISLGIFFVLFINSLFSQFYTFDFVNDEASLIYNDCGNINMGQWASYPDGENIIDITSNQFYICDVEGDNCATLNDGGDNQNFWESIQVDISEYCLVKLCVTYGFDNPSIYAGDPDLECNCSCNGEDYLGFEYSLDGGPWILWDPSNPNIICINETGNGYELCSSNLSGNTVAIRIQFATQSISEAIVLNDLQIFEVTVDITVNAEANETTLCAGANLELYENGGSAASWSWSGPNGFNSNQQNPVITNVTTANSGTYSVTITDANGCQTSDEVEIKINPSPLASLSGDIDFCPDDCFNINTSISGGTSPYNADFSISIPGFPDYNFNIPSYDINNQLEICYSGTNPLPSFSGNTLTVPTIYTGTATLTLEKLESADGCLATNINPDEITLTFKEKLDINNYNPDPICDADGDGIVNFDLSIYEFAVSGGSGADVIWCEDANCNIQISTPSSYLSGPATVYVYLSDNTGNQCNSEIIPIILTIFELPSAGNDNSISICNTEECENFWIDIDLIDDTGGVWSDDSYSNVDLDYPYCIDFSDVTEGIYYFTYTTSDPLLQCTDFSILTVEVFEVKNAGDDNYLTICNNTQNSINLETLLSSDADLDGEWTDEIGNVITDPTNVDISTYTNGLYEFYYTFDNLSCGLDFATISIEIVSELNAGDDNQINICFSTDDIYVDLENALGFHDILGDWNDVNSSNVDLTIPSNVNFSNVPVGTYAFVYYFPQGGDCAIDFATITVFISNGPVAGTNNNFTLCKGSTQIFDLYSYLGPNYQSGGNWTQINGDTYNISDFTNVSFETAEVDVYAYEYTVISGCGESSAIISITINDITGAGDDYHRTVCQNSVINLNDSLKNNILGGNWFDINNNLVNNPDSFFINFLNDSVLLYIIDPFGCGNDTSEAMIHVIEGPFAGNDNSFIVCQGNNDIVDLYNYIPGYTTGGTFYKIDNGIYNSSSNFINFSTYPIGIDSFVYIVSSECGSDTSIISTNITTSPSAGDPYEITVCQNYFINLYDSLKNYTQGGIWYFEDNSIVSDPENLSLPDAKTYNFKYVIPASGGCLSDTAFIKINTIEAPYAGIANDFSVCNNTGNNINFFDHLTGNYSSGGDWKFNSSFLISDPDNFDYSAFGVGNYLFSYIVQATSICQADTANLILTIEQKPDPGNDVQIDVCNGEINNVLNFDILIGSHDTGGQWINNYQPTINTSNTLNVSFKNISVGTYLFYYKIDSINVCGADSAKLEVSVLKKSFAGNDKTLTFCEGEINIINLITELNPEQNISYQYRDVNSTGALNSSTGNIDISNLNEGNYNFELITGIGEMCGTDTSKLQISVVKSPNSGLDNSITVCNNEKNIDIDGLLGIHDQGGLWNDIDNSGVDLLSSNAKSVSFEGLKAGIYHYEYKFSASANCPESKSIIEVNVNPVSISDYVESICDGQTIVINGHNYDSSDLIGTEYLTNQYGCDSIVNVKLTLKNPLIYSESFDENCFGVGKYQILDQQQLSFPLTLDIQGIGIYQINNLPYQLDNLAAGNYNFTLTDNLGCTINNGNFIINEFVPFSINIDVEQLENYYILTTTTNIVPESIKWSPSEGLNCSDCLVTNATPLNDQQYIIEIMDSEGCTVSDTVLLNRLVDINIEIPNVFSPNGDGLNDRFFVKCNECTETYNMHIFDRWGEKIFFAENLAFNDHTYGWDGKFKGKTLNPGVYVYFIEINKQEKEIIAGDILIVK